MMATTLKPFSCLVLDAGPILKNDPSIDTLLAKADELTTVPNVISEIRDRNARQRIETQLLPFLKLQIPRPASIEVVSSFAKKTGDFSVLSRTDIEVLALAYEREVEKNGDKHLRKAPVTKALTKAPTKHTGTERKVASATEKAAPSLDTATHPQPSTRENTAEPTETLDIAANLESTHLHAEPQPANASSSPSRPHTESQLQPTELIESSSPSQTQPDLQSQSNQPYKSIDPTSNPVSNTEEDQDPTLDSDGDSAASEGWITPSNIKKHQAKADQSQRTSPDPSTPLMTTATLTTDFAMQNTLLQLNLPLLSPSLTRIRTLKTFILRCHACFNLVHDTSKQFCPRCGKPTLTRVSCSTDAKGVFRVHLKKNMEWHHRGERYSIPKPVHGSSSGKVGNVKGGGHGGWGQGLVLAEDQKEYVRAVGGVDGRGGKGKGSGVANMMDEDYLPGILTGRRDRPGGRPKIGAGRNVNAKKRRD